MDKTAAATPTSAGVAWPPVLWIAGLHAGALLAFVPAYFSWSAVVACLVLHWMTGSLGICMTYHRLLTHRSFTLRPSWLEYPLTALACCASEGGPIQWVCDHRRHHAHADDEHDVHSPRRGFAWAHALWWVIPDLLPTQSPEHYARWTPDLVQDRVHRWLNRWHYAFPVLLGVGLFAVGGMPWLVWGCFVRTVLLLHATWFVNSAAHTWGHRPYPTRDTSTNLWWVALLSYGEGWHNNHHAFPTSARHGLRWWQLDTTYAAIRALALIGLIRGVKRPKLAGGPSRPGPAAEGLPLAVGALAGSAR